MSNNWLNSYGFYWLISPGSNNVEFVEYGKAKVDMGFPVFNYAVGYDVNNREPLFYEKYPGSIVDISQLKRMPNKAEGYGYKKVGFILDRGCFGKQNIEHMDKCGYSFVLMVKEMQDLVSALILENKGTFENKRTVIWMVMGCMERR